MEVSGISPGEYVWDQKKREEVFLEIFVTSCLHTREGSRGKLLDRKFFVVSIATKLIVVVL